MAQTVLLLDTGCGPCSTIGRQIAAEGLLDESPVELGSLHDEYLRGIVQDVRPDVRWEPTLLQRDGDSTKVATGLRLAVELTAILGIRRAYRISQLVRELAQGDVTDPSRRTFLVKFASAAAAVPLVGVGGLTRSPAKKIPQGVLQAIVAADSPLCWRRLWRRGRASVHPRPPPAVEIAACVSFAAVFGIATYFVYRRTGLASWYEER